jgi:hypothetical protein
MITKNNMTSNKFFSLNGNNRILFSALREMLLYVYGMNKNRLAQFNIDSDSAKVSFEKVNEALKGGAGGLFLEDEDIVNVEKTIRFFRYDVDVFGESGDFEVIVGYPPYVLDEIVVLFQASG